MRNYIYRVLLVDGMNLPGELIKSLDDEKNYRE